MTGDVQNSSKRLGGYRRYGRIADLLGLELLIGIVVAVLLPWIIYAIFNADARGPSARNALLGSGVALTIGYYIFSSFVNFPGVRGGSYILPSFASGYATVLTAFFFGRLEYSRFQFLTSFILALLCYYAQFFLIQRRKRRRLGVVPGGKIGRLRTISSVDWWVFDEIPATLAKCDGIVADLHADMPDEWERFIADCAIAGLPVFHYKQVQESLTGAVQIEHLSENNLGSLVPGFAFTRLKAIIDFSAAVVSGLVLLPFLILVAIAIRIDSPGPALFRQQRMGFRGRPFTVFKFRTMRHSPGGEGENARTAAITQAADARVTRLGKMLRHYRIDELPQLLNIIRGEMSWIGPRPEAMVLSRWYEAELPFYRYRHIVRPGVTGWAQVNQGHVADVQDVLGKLNYDFYYIKYFSPWLDLLIVLRTIRTVLTGFGSK